MFITLAFDAAAKADTRAGEAAQTAVVRDIPGQLPVRAPRRSSPTRTITYRRRKQSERATRLELDDLLPPCDHVLTVPSLTLTGRSLVCRRPPPTTLPRQPAQTVRARSTIRRPQAQGSLTAASLVPLSGIVSGTHERPRGIASAPSAASGGKRAGRAVVLGHAGDGRDTRTSTVGRWGSLAHVCVRALELSEL